MLPFQRTNALLGLLAVLLWGHALPISADAPSPAPAVSEPAVPPDGSTEEPIEPTPFHWLQEEPPTQLRAALDAGLNPNLRNKQGETLLMYASGEWNEPEPAFYLLLERGANINARSKSGSTALMWASANFNPIAVRELLRRGAAFDARDRDGETALHRSTQWSQGCLLICGREQQHARCIEILLEAGADPDAKDRTGMTPLMAAASYNHAPSFHALLRGGADVHRLDSRGRSALTWRAAWGGVDPLVCALLEAGAKPSLMDALELNDLSLARMLIRSRYRRNSRGLADRTLLHQAAFLGDLELVRTLLADGASVTARDREGSTVLMTALGAIQRFSQVGLYFVRADRTEGRSALIALLAKKGAPLDSHDRHGHTALTWAVKLKRPDLVRALLAAGANPNDSGRWYRPLELATREGDSETAQILLAARAKRPSKDK